MKTKNILLVILIIVVLVGIAYLGYGYYEKLQSDKVPNPIATIEVENFGTIKVELYPDKAANTVTNFITLANNGFYDGLTFHRISKDFMIQGGDVKGDGSGSPTLSAIDKSIEAGSEQDTEYNLEGEFIANGYKTNNIRHERGVISMARQDYSSQVASLQQMGYNTKGLLEEGYNSAGSQFFIMTQNNTSLDGVYTAFGKVIEGMEVVDAISSVEIDTSESETSETPVKAPVITSIRVETYGKDYGMPKTKTPFDYTSWLMQQYYSSGNTSDTEDTIEVEQ